MIRPGGTPPRLQILTIGELLDGKGVNMPPISQVNVTFMRGLQKTSPCGEAFTAIQ